MKCEILASEKAQLCITSLQELKDESNVIDYGAIILCKGGTASMRIDFKDWHLKQYAVITLFPNDVVMLHDVSDDFEVEMLRYDKTLLREASLQLEQTVYSLLRKDRCRTDKQVVTLIIENMFSLLRLYFIQEECMCLDQLVLYQLKAFFLGFYDWMVRNRHEAPEDNGSRRTNELFNMFMEDPRTELHEIAYCGLLCRQTEHHVQISEQYRKANDRIHDKGHYRPICHHADQTAAAHGRQEREATGMGLQLQR